MRKFAAVALLLLLGEIAGAQIPTSGNVFFGYSTTAPTSPEAESV